MPLHRLLFSVSINVCNPHFITSDNMGKTFISPLWKGSKKPRADVNIWCLWTLVNIFSTHCAHSSWQHRVAVTILNNVVFESSGNSMIRSLIVKLWFVSYFCIHTLNMIVSQDAKPLTPLFIMNIWTGFLKLMTPLSNFSFNHCSRPTCFTQLTVNFSSSSSSSSIMSSCV